MTTPAQPPKQLVLLGAGHAHVHVLSTLATQPMAGVQITLVAPYPRQLYSGMVPGFVAGHYALDDCVIPLEPLLQNTGIRWLTRSATGLDANARTVTLDDGSTLSFDWLSVNTGPVQDRVQIEQTMPGAREHGLFVRPIESFGALWPRVAELAKTRALRVAVIGGGAAGIELAMAIRHGLGSSSVTLVAGAAAVGANYTPAVQQRVVKALKRRNITVLPDLAVGIQAGEVLLGCGARLACDVPLIATGAQAPAWLAGSGLALDANGFIAVDACQRSTSHAHVFAAGDVSTRVDRAIARSGVYAVRAGPALANNLAAAIAGREPSPHQPPENTLNLISCGDRQAIASWGHYAAQGRWVWWLKDRIDRAFIKRYSRPPLTPAGNIDSDGAPANRR
ncbi:MAG: FAD-dependent oxidoreductase [Rhodoferax sp.]|nr:FAD-dependent oxidoreductase [Rhodoferax sp.]